MSIHRRQWLLYGATGYTGRLTAELAKQRGLEPVLAARNADTLRPLAQTLNAEYRVFDLQDAVRLREALRGVTAVLHMAGHSRPRQRPCSMRVSPWVAIIWISAVKSQPSSSSTRATSRPPRPGWY